MGWIDTTIDLSCNDKMRVMHAPDINWFSTASLSDRENKLSEQSDQHSFMSAPELSSTKLSRNDTPV
jgi:hypothetical protein